VTGYRAAARDAPIMIACMPFPFIFMFMVGIFLAATLRPVVLF